MNKSVFSLSFDYHGQKITFVVKRRRRKTLGILVRDSETVEVSAPLQLSKEKIMEMVQRKAHWILQKKNMWKERESFGNQGIYEEGSKILYLGNSYCLGFHENRTTSVPSLQEGILLMPALPFHSGHLSSTLENWYRKECKEIIYQRVEHYSTMIPVTIAAVKIREQKRRWGSSTSKGNLIFNWKLIMAPLPVIDYVVVHEMCHQLHMNHSPAFWEAVEKILPDYRERKKWLKEHGYRLQV